MASSFSGDGVEPPAPPPALLVAELRRDDADVETAGDSRIDVSR